MNRLGPIESRGFEPGLPRLVARAQQRVSGEIRGRRRQASALQARATNRRIELIVEKLSRGARPVSVAEANRDIGVVTLEVFQRRGCSHVEIDVGMRSDESADPRQQPAGGEGRYDADA